jgi:hypothetical protein
MALNIQVQGLLLWAFTNSGPALAIYCNPQLPAAVNGSSSKEQHATSSSVITLVQVSDAGILSP